MASSIIKDPKLAPEGRTKIRWVEQHAPVLNAIYEKYLSDGTLRGLSIAVCVPLEAKTACRRPSTRSTTSRESCCCSTRLALTDSAFARNSSSKWDLGDLAKAQDAAPVTRSSSASEVVPSASHRDPSIRRVRTFARVHASRSKGSPARS